MDFIQGSAGSCDSKDPRDPDMWSEWLKSFVLSLAIRSRHRYCLENWLAFMQHLSGISSLVYNTCHIHTQIYTLVAQTAHHKR